MTFAEFKTRVLRAAFPLGEPENLSFDDYVISGLIEVQRWIPCFRYRHDDVFPACNTFWHCGATVVTVPRGRILRAYTVERTEDGIGWCHPVILNPVSLRELRRWQASFRSQWITDLYLPPSSGRGLPMGFDVPTTSSDAVSGRAMTGLYALDASACRLYVAPWLQTTESLIIEWQGIKRSWSDADLVSDDPDFLRLVRCFVEREYGRKWASEDLPIRERAWSEALADMIVTCSDETRLHGEPRTAEEADLAAFAPYVAPSSARTEADPEEVNISFVGDTGNAGEDAQAVAAAVTADNPDGYVFLVGDCKYPPNSGMAGMAPYEDYVLAGRARAVLGDNDLNDGALGSDVTSYAQNPGNGRYYVQRIGPVSVFVINAGLNSADEMVEPDGNYPGSRQWQEVSSAILRDTSPWKIAVLHQAPFTSSDEYYPGEDKLRWVSDLPVHAVVAAHGRLYERLTVRDRLHFVVGTGGIPLHGVSDPVYPGSEVQAAAFGFLRLQATCDVASFDFVDTDGVVVDTVALEAGPASQPPVIPPNDPFVADQPAPATTVEATQPAELSIDATGNAPLVCQWYLNGSPIPGETSNVLNIAAAADADGGTYVCVVSNGYGAVASDPAVLTVVPFTGEYPGGDGPIYPYPTIQALRESSANGLAVVVISDANGELAHFTRSDDPVADDGHNGVITGSGTYYKRA